MIDPVITYDGQTYERRAIEHWFRIGKSTSPLTGLPLQSRSLIPNIILSSIIEEYKEKMIHSTNK